MEYRDVVARRRMVRRFTADPVDDETIDRIVATIRSGPTAGYAQGVSAVTVTDPEIRSAIAVAGGEPEYLERGFDPWLSVAPVHMVLCVEPERYRRRYAEQDKDAAALQIPWWWVDGGAAMVLGVLAAIDEGLAAGFLGGHSFEGLHALLGIPEEVEIVGILTVGYPAPDRRSRSLRRGRRDSGSYRDRWGADAGQSDRNEPLGS